MKLILGSRSPRRIELLSTLGLPFEVVPADIDESEVERSHLGCGPEELSLAVARAKFAAIRRISAEDTIIISADTVVFLNGMSLGKPETEFDALIMLESLLGQRHVVATAVVIGRVDQQWETVTTACVEMWDAGRSQLEAYVNSGEPLDKAGGYAIQGLGSELIRSVAGCYLAVVGFPLCAVGSLLSAAGLRSLSNPTRICHERAIEVAGRGSAITVPPHPEGLTAVIDGAGCLLPR